MTANGDLRSSLDRGDLRAAAAWLVDRYAHEVLSLCRAMTRDEAIAEDLAQDVFGRAFGALAGFRGDASPRTWLLAIARNRCIDHLRAARRDPWAGAAGDADPDEQPSEGALPDDLLMQRVELRAALEELSEGERALVVLRFLHGLDYGELSGVLGVREGTLRMRLHRALAKLRESLEVRERVEAEETLTAALQEPADAFRAAAPPATSRLRGQLAEPLRHGLAAALSDLDPGVPARFAEALRDRVRALSQRP